MLNPMKLGLSVITTIVLIVFVVFLLYALINGDRYKNNIRKHCEQRSGKMHYDSYCILPSGEQMTLTFSEITEK